MLEIWSMEGMMIKMGIKAGKGGNTHSDCQIKYFVATSCSLMDPWSMHVCIIIIIHASN